MTEVIDDGVSDGQGFLLMEGGNSYWSSCWKGPAPPAEGERQE